MAEGYGSSTSKEDASARRGFYHGGRADSVPRFESVSNFRVGDPCFLSMVCDRRCQEEAKASKASNTLEGRYILLRTFALDRAPRAPNPFPAEREHRVSRERMRIALSKLSRFRALPN